MNSIILLEGGHTTYVEGLSPQNVEKYLTDMRKNQFQFGYLQADNYPDNGIVFDPNKVVGVVASSDR